MDNILTYNGQKINQREDGYVNATQMAKANNKRVNNWLQLEATKAYIEELARTTGIPVNQIHAVKSGAPEFGGGTWVHPLLALDLGRWISPAFAIWCDQHIKTLIETGSTSIVTTPQTFSEALFLAAKIQQEKEELEKQQELLAAENDELVEEVERQAEVIDELFNYSSIIRVAKFNNCSEKAFNWRKLKAACKVLQLEIKSAPCPRFGTKKLYPHDAWQYVYPHYKLPESEND